MARGFRYKKSIPVEYDLQGYIYFTSRQFRNLPEKQREAIQRMIREAAGMYAKALFAFVTSDEGATAVCMEYNLSASTLERMVKKYYVLFAEEYGTI